VIASLSAYRIGRPRQFLLRRPCAQTLLKPGTFLFLVIRGKTDEAQFAIRAFFVCVHNLTDANQVLSDFGPLPEAESLTGPVLDPNLAARTLARLHSRGISFPSRPRRLSRRTAPFQSKCIFLFSQASSASPCFRAEVPITFSFHHIDQQRFRARLARPLQSLRKVGPCTLSVYGTASCACVEPRLKAPEVNLTHNIP